MMMDYAGTPAQGVVPDQSILTGLKNALKNFGKAVMKINKCKLEEAIRISESLQNQLNQEISLQEPVV